jgi:hypothetical protein
MADLATQNSGSESLPEFLSQRARRLSDRRLAVDSASGLLVGAFAAIWQPPGWIPLCGAAVAFGALGVWGILDRELRERQSRSRGTATLRLGRAMAATFAATGAILLLLSLLAVALGRWIS